MMLSTIRVLAAGVIAATIGGDWSRALAQGTPDDFVITLERTACFGECPVYSVSIDAKGNVTYDGEQFVRVEGRQTDHIQPSRAAALLATAERIGFFQLADRYRTIRNPDGSETTVSDLPTAFVTISRGSRSKRIEDYIGTPRGLKELEQQIDDTARTTRWIRLDEATLRQLVREGRPPSAEERAEFLRTALQYDEVDVVKALLENGADANAAYHGTNTTPLMMVRSAAAARALIDAGAVPSLANENGVTPLARAAYLPEDVTEVLLKAGVPVDQPVDADGTTALWKSACAGNIGAVRVLLRAGADPASRSHGVSAIECARQGKESGRSRPPDPFEGRRLFAEDFDGVTATLQRALAQRKGPK